MEPKKGLMVRYVHKIDTDPTEIPNISPAIITKVNQATKDAISARVFHTSGEFIDFFVEHDEGKGRGTWHWPDDLG